MYVLVNLFADQYIVISYLQPFFHFYERWNYFFFDK